MRNFGPNDPIPCNVFNSGEIELIDVDDSPRFEPSERMKRLPSYRAAEEARITAVRVNRATQLRPYGVLPDSKQSHNSLAAFNGNCDPHITEADCRKPQPITRGLDEIRVGDLVRVTADCSWFGVVMTVTDIRDDIAGCGDVKFRLSSLEKYTPEARQPKADAEGWITHDGTCMPVAAETVVEVKKRHGSVFQQMDAGYWAASGTNCWVIGECHEGFDIVAYRVVG